MVVVVVVVEDAVMWRVPETCLERREVVNEAVPWTRDFNGGRGSSPEVVCRVEGELGLIPGVASDLA